MTNPLRGGRRFEPRWKRLGKRRFKEVEELLRQWEPYGVSACARFLHLSRMSDQLWGLRDPEGALSALLLHSRRSLFPVFCNTAEVKGPGFISRFLKKNRVHAIQGLYDDVLTLEGIMTGLGIQSADRIDYDLMSLDHQPATETLRAGPQGLIVRRPGIRELEAILPLQTAYELEEVLPQGATFNAPACRLNLEHILKGEQVLVAELDGRIIAKVNTSAVSFTRVQIGGVFVHPDYRGKGIARQVCAELTKTLIAAGWGVSLFVKKRNQSAQAVYRSIGFRSIADYRIVYY
jgi:ribosomal protein S18 acetylase RimI-like enzyme